MSTDFDPRAYITSDDFVGWYIGGSATPTQPFTCGSPSTWSSSGHYAGCLTSKDILAVRCAGLTLYGAHSEHGTCLGDATCISIKIYNTQNDLTAPWTMVSCTSNWDANSVYRHLTAPPTSTISSIGRSKTDTGTLKSNPLPPVTNILSSSQPSEPLALSAGAIAGIAAAGCVVVILILALIVFRRKILAHFHHTQPHSQPADSSLHISRQSNGEVAELPGEGAKVAARPPVELAHNEVAELE